jgi:outer membrane protein assembly factor BamA
MKNEFNKFCRISAYIILLNLTFYGTIYGQEKDTLTLNRGTITQEDLSDVIRQALNKPPKVKPASEGSLLLLPIIGSNPATGFMFGVGGQYAFKVPGSSLYSAFMGSVQVTTKSQFLFLLKNNIYTKNNRWFFSGDWRFQIFSQDTWGLGTNSPDGGIIDYQYSMFGIQTSMDSLAQPMKFDFARLHQSVSIKITDGFYAGLGYQFDSYFKIVDEKLRLNPGDTLITSHYAYNDKYGFRKDQYFNSALNVNLIYDTRDNMINPYKGIYAVLSWRGGMKILGNKDPTNTFSCEWRSFHGLSKANPRHLIAFWLLGNFSKSGELPYMILPATSYDQRSRSARGYTQGRYRGNNFVYGEAEYRFPISKPGGILGGVVFANATSTNNVAQDLKLFESVRPGYGFGLRIMADKNSRTNLAIDYGFGYKSSGFYLAASEVF